MKMKDLYFPEVDKKFYNPKTLLLKKDLNGEEPETFFCQSNRTGGKTVNVVHFALENQLRGNFRKIGFLTRYTTETIGLIESLFHDVVELFYPGAQYYSSSNKEDKFPAIYFNDKQIGWVLSLNGSDWVRKRSSLFSEIDCLIMDEFQSEKESYLTKELISFQSIHQSIARGRGEFSRYVPVIMLSNGFSSINPYYHVYGISDRLRSDTKFLRGEGWILENYYNPNAHDAQLQSAFMKPFLNSDYFKAMNSGGFLYDNTAFIQQLKGNNRYICTIKYGNDFFSIKEYPAEGLLYCDTAYDGNFPIKYSVTPVSHAPGLMMSANSMITKSFRDYYNAGLFRFKNQRAQKALIEFISIR